MLVISMICGNGAIPVLAEGTQDAIVNDSGNDASQGDTSTSATSDADSDDEDADASDEADDDLEEDENLKSGSIALFSANWSIAAFGASFGSALTGPVITATTPVAAGQPYNAYPALKDQYQGYFYVGTIDQFNNSTRSDVISYHFNAVTNENNMKPGATQQTKGTFVVEPAMDSMTKASAAFGSNGGALIGHTLAWHSQSPNWMWDNPTFNKATAEQNLKDHIQGTLTTPSAGYPNGLGEALYAIDVVNEAVASSKTSDPYDWKSAVGQKGEGWSQALGYEFIEIAFKAAADVVDAKNWDVKLYYNDFGLDSPTKARIVYNMVKEVNESNASYRTNGKPLIEGIGMQGHYNRLTNMQQVEENIVLFSELGIYVSFTEVDVEMITATGTLSDEMKIQQGQVYAQLFDLCKRYAAGSANTGPYPNVVERVTMWGVDDAGHWKAGALPVLFEGGTYLGKEALVAALWPEDYLAKHPVSNTKPEPKELPGVHVYSRDNGDDFDGVNIITGNNAAVWPYSTGAKDADDIAFTPQQGKTYRLTVDWTRMGASGLGVRWLKDDSKDSFTSADIAAYSTLSNSGTTNYPGTTSSASVPAKYEGGVNMNTFRTVTYITFDGSASAEGLIGNIALRGSPSVEDGLRINTFQLHELTGGSGSSAVAGDPLINWPQYEEVGKDDSYGKRGVFIADYVGGNFSWGGANIILGNNPNAWPWSTGGDLEPAFTPVKGGEYLIEINWTSYGASNIRLRWLKDNSNGSYTQADGAAVSASQSIPVNGTATKLPAVTTGGATGGTYTTSIRMKLDGSQPADGLIGNIAVRGTSGSNSFTVNQVKVTKIGTGGENDQLLVNYPDGCDESFPGIDGVSIYDYVGGNSSWGGANIILGKNASVWPWSTAGADGKTAFTPFKNARYRFSINWTSYGASNIRLRWVKDDSNGNYTQADGAAVGASQSVNVNGTATKLPAVTTGGATGGTYTTKAELILDGSIPADGLIGNIAVRGTSGSNSFTVNEVTVETQNIDGTWRTLVDYPSGNALQYATEPIARTTDVTYTANVQTPATGTTATIKLTFNESINNGLTAPFVTLTDTDQTGATKGELTVVEGTGNKEWNLAVSNITKKGTAEITVNWNGVEATAKTVTLGELPPPYVAPPQSSDTGGSSSSGTGTSTTSNTTTTNNTTVVTSDPTPSVVASPDGNWVKDGTGWWFKNPNSAYPSNSWQTIGGKWYFFNDKGYAQNGWVFDNRFGSWYHLAKDSLEMNTGWLKDPTTNSWYFLADSGAMQTGWLYDKSYGSWYYLQEDGSMKTGWTQDKKTGLWYYLNKTGDMAVNTTTPDGYKVNEKGVWVR